MLKTLKITLLTLAIFFRFVPINVFTSISENRNDSLGKVLPLEKGKKYTPYLQPKIQRLWGYTGKGDILASNVDAKVCLFRVLYIIDASFSRGAYHISGYG